MLAPSGLSSRSSLIAHVCVGSFYCTRHSFHHGRPATVDSSLSLSLSLSAHLRNRQPRKQQKMTGTFHACPVA
ncbi:hypothetical protein VTH06DRAFT_863 [Thermothelomyces fergusii]